MRRCARGGAWQGAASLPPAVKVHAGLEVVAPRRAALELLLAVRRLEHRVSPAPREQREGECAAVLERLAVGKRHPHRLAALIAVRRARAGHRQRTEQHISRVARHRLVKIGVGGPVLVRGLICHLPAGARALHRVKRNVMQHAGPEHPALVQREHLPVLLGCALFVRPRGSRREVPPHSRPGRSLGQGEALARRRPGEERRRARKGAERDRIAHLEDKQQRVLAERAERGKLIVKGRIVQSMSMSLPP